jgi:predicted Zn-dependent protease
MARRLNTRFLTILLLVVAGAGGALILAARFLIHEHPDRFIELGKQSMKDHKWQDAVNDFARAGNLAPHDPEIQMMLGTALDQVVQTDPSAIQLEVGAYQKALEIDPKYLPALKALSALFTREAGKDPTAYLYTNAIQYTKEARDLDPSDEKLFSLYDKLVIQEWSTGLSTDQKPVDDAVKEMKDLWAKNPADADLPYSIASAEAEEGLLIARQNPGVEQLPEVTKHYKNAVATFESVLSGPNGGSQAQNPNMHFAFARTLEQLSSVDQSSPDVSKQDQDRAVKEITSARNLVKPADPDYQDINETAAGLALRHGDRDGAIAIYKSMPQSPRTEIALADVLSRTPNTQAEAVALLKNTLASLTDDPSQMAFYGNRFLTTMELTKIQIFQYLEMPSGTEKQKAHDEIRSTLDKLNDVTGIRTYYPVKEIEARFEIGSGLEEEMQEVQTLSKLMADSPPPTKDYYWYSLQSLLAQGYEDTNQTSKALEIFQSIAQQFPRDVPTQEHLIRLLLVEQPDQARPHIEELAQLDPTDPALNLFYIQQLLADPDKNKDAIQKFYNNLKENSVNMLSAKARVAMRIKNYDDAIRLFKLVNAQAPNRVDDWIMLSRLQYMLDKKDESLDTATRGLAANPSDPQLRLLIPRIKGESSQVVDELQKQLEEENPDKTQGDVALAALANRDGDAKQEEIHLEAANKESPGNPHILDLLFNYYLHNKKFEQAGKCIPELAQLDADRAGGELYRLALAEAQGDNTGSEAIARGLTQNKPEFARSWLAMGDVLQNEGRYDEAIPQYNNCLQRESSLAEGYIGLARCYYALHRNDDALHTIQDGLNRLPDNQTLSEMKLSHEISYGKPEEAIAELKQELVLHPNNPRLCAALGQATLRYCELLRENHQDNDVIKQAQRAVDMLKDPLTASPDYAELYTTMSECQLAAHHNDDAMKTLEDWAARPAWTKQPEPYLAMSELYERFGVHDKAEEEMQTAMARSGYRVDLQIRMASLLSLHKKYDDSIALLRSVNSDQPDVQEKIVQILLIANRFDDAQAELNTDLAKNPPNAERLLATWALALYERGMYPEAIDRSTQALALTPNDPTALFCRARANLRVRPPNADSALQDLQLVRRTSPDNIEVRLTLSDTYVMLNRPEDAINELEAGVRALPENKQLRMKLMDLYENGAHPRLTAALKLLQDVDGVPPYNKDPDIFENESIILAKMGNNDEALAKDEIARQLAPDSVSIIRTEMQLLLDTQNYQGVFDRYNALTDKLKSSSWALWDLALAEKRTSNPQSLPDFDRAINMSVSEDRPEVLDALARTVVHEFTFNDAVTVLQPISEHYVPAKLTLARLYQGHGDDAAALSDVDSVMADFDKLSRRDQINLLTNAAIMYQIAKPTPMVDKAYDAYTAWLKLEPDNLEALNNMACLLADSYSPPRAQEGLKYANEAVSQMSRIGRTEPRMLDTQAWLLILTGSADDGVDILNKAMDEFAPFPEEYLHLGEGYLRKETPDPVQAETQAKLGLQLVNRRNAGDEDADVRAKLQDLINRSEDARHKQQQAQVP